MTLRQLPRTLLLIITLAVSLSACLKSVKPLRQDQVLTIAWNDLRPYTSSQNRRNWEYINADRVYGREVVNEFPSLRISNCPGPTPPENGVIRSSSEYWFIRVVPTRMLAPTQKSADSTTPSSIEPEPLIMEVQYLVDPFTGQVIARKFVCDVE